MRLWSFLKLLFRLTLLSAHGLALYTAIFGRITLV